jgi:hypothetical protein
MIAVLFVFALTAGNIADGKASAFNGKLNNATSKSMNAVGQTTHDVLNGAIAKVKAL